MTGINNPILSRMIDDLLKTSQSRERRSPKELRKYALISTPRTGSTMLCELLKKAGLGWPAEWFNDLYVHIYMQKDKKGGTSLQDYLNDVVAGSYTEHNNVLGINFHTVHHELWLRHGFNLLSIDFDHIYYIERKDVMRQAYSMAKAMKTGLWSRQAEIAAGYSQPLEVKVTLEELMIEKQRITRYKTYYEEILKPHVSKTFIYEDLIAGKLPDAVKTISNDLSVTIPEEFDFIPTEEKQSNQFDKMQIKKLLKKYEEKFKSAVAK